MSTSRARDFLASHSFVLILTILSFLIIAIALFEAGVSVGFREASFDAHWQENYERNFGRSATPLGLPDRHYPRPNGAAGTIVSVSLPTFVIAGPAETEKVIRINADTLIRGGSGVGTTTALSSGVRAVVLGEPNASGEIEARFIRILSATTSPQ